MNNRKGVILTGKLFDFSFLYRFVFFLFSYTESVSQLWAYIHQIKLYFHYILSRQFLEVGVRFPAKLDAECVRLSFDEMRREGFADDGLFDQMKLFFLPLTMVEDDLVISGTRWKSISTRLSIKVNSLMERKRDLARELNEKEDEYYRHDDAIRNLRRTQQPTTQKSDHARANGRYNDSKDGGIMERANQIISSIWGRKSTSSENNGEQTDHPSDSPPLTTSHETQDKYETFSTIELIRQHRQAMKTLEPIREKLRSQIEATDDLISSFDQSFYKEKINNDTKSDRDLIKPNRGFIMYGPPGRFLRRKSPLKIAL
jgi:hypothetical protein